MVRSPEGSRSAPSVWPVGRAPPHPRRERAVRTTAFVIVAGLLFAGISLAASTPARATGAAQVLAITQNPGTIGEQDAVTVGLQVADASNIQQIYFTFCQLTNSLCYLPVVMSPQASNWFVGTTSPMSEYSGMGPGVSAGYNITIVYNDNSTSSEPSFPNAFSNLTVAATVTGEFVYKVTVAIPTYALGGRVYDAATGAGIAGATVSLTPSNGTSTVTTDATGAYTFPPMPNGSYTLAVNRSGYVSTSVSIVVHDQAVVQDVPLTSSTTGTGTTHSSGSPGFLGTTTGLAVVGALVVIGAIAVAGVLLARRRRSTNEPPVTRNGETPPTAR